jgi:hypothetical protein
VTFLFAAAGPVGRDLFRTHPAGYLAGALIAAVPSISACTPQASPPRAIAAADALPLIQRECLNAYPPELLGGLTHGKTAIPPEVTADPTRQTDFLDADLPVEKGIFYPSLLEELLPAFKAYVRPGTRFLDLGSGDGRVVFLAAWLGADASGIEYEPRIFAASVKAAAALDQVAPPERVHLMEGDFFASHWSGFDVIFFFGYGSFERERLGKKLVEEMDPGAHLISAHEDQPFEGLVVEATFPEIKVYRRPAIEP